ncbi:CHAT domain-containing tetratricopeptide repeat protein [Streptomyces sp. LMG1-1-1.1]|uniref:CHAT domain-containing tetratricopeptide repeat protein n=1 Tax=Streptomyces sp. LMG1-1-1.1 TaxID=3135245 RepID=UPI003466575E
MRWTRELMALVADPSADPEAVRAIADLHRCRSLVLGPEAGREDAAVAAALDRIAGPEAPTDTVDAQEDGRVATVYREASDRVAAAQRDQDPALLEQAIQASEVAVDVIPERLRPLRATALALRGVSLRLRYVREGSPRDLDDAVTALREAESTAGGGHPDRAWILSTLAAALRERHDHGGGLDDVLEAVRVARAAVEAGGEVDRAGRLYNLGLALRRRHERTRDPADLEEAVAVHREAVALTPADHHDHGLFQQGLANALRARYELGGREADFEARVEALEVAASLPTGDPPEGDDGSRTAALLNLASALTERHERTGEDGDARRAESLLRAASAALPPEHVQQAFVRYQLGLLLGPRDRTAAAAELRTAAFHPAAPPRLRLRAAHAWARGAMEAGSPEEASTAYGQAVAQLPALVPRHLAPADAEQALADTQGLASDAAACALTAGDAGGALALLELGRGVLLGQGLKHHDELARLRAHAPESADRLAWLRARLDADPEASPSDRRHEWAAEWDRLVGHVRARGGFEDFMRPPHPARLLPQAADGPVVLVNVSRFRCDALALTADGLRVVPLPDLTLPDVLARTTSFLAVLDRLQNPDDTDLMARLSGEEELDGHLAWLWDTVTGPVLDALGLTGPAGARPPRVWWIPTGPLAFLPLHAAGHHGEGAGRTVLDRTVSSYAPTVRALAQSRRPADTPPAPSFLVVAVPEAPAARPLPGAAEEATAVAGMLTGARLIAGADATRDAVVTALGDHTWLHFCGHGAAEPATASGSRLLVHDHLDHPLTVAALARLDLPSAELAYLSACTTARSGFTAMDEALHLAGGLHLAGFRHVLGSLWEIDDTVSLRIAARVYAGLGAPHPVAARAAHALHDAVRETRDRYPATPSLWAAYIHVGP